MDREKRQIISRLKMLKRILIASLISTLLMACGKSEDSDTIPYKTYLEQVSCKNTYYYTINDSLFIFIPNIFTPNADGINDVLLVGTNATINNLKFVLMNSKGDTIIESQTQNQLLFANPVVPDISTICSFTLTGTVLGNPITMSGYISILIFDWDKPDTYQLQHCDSCQFSSMFDLDSLNVYLDPTKFNDVICN